jgi:serine/threonine-protein phosphatase 2B regulatory subunit
MKLDKVRQYQFVQRISKLTRHLVQDKSGTIEREEFLSLPQVSSNPLATR